MKLTLDKNELTGTLPHGLYDLVNLETFSMSRNNVTGRISPKIGNLINLKELSFKDNWLSGYIPGEMANLLSLGKSQLLFQEYKVTKLLTILISVKNFSNFKLII